MIGRLKEMLIKEFIQIFRDPRTRLIIFIPPMIQLLIFGYAVTTDVRNAATAIYDQDNSVASRELISRFIRSRYFRVGEYIQREKDIRLAIDHSRVKAVLQINKGFEEDLRSGRTAPVQMIVDATDSNTASILLDYGQRIVREYSREILLKRAGRTGTAVHAIGSLELESRAWFNENLESRNFYVPGVLAILLMLVTLMLTSMAVVREKEMGTMEQIAVTPMSPMEFILGKTLPFALVGFVDMILVVLIAWGWFQIPIRGHIGWLVLGTGLYLMTTLGMGLLISTISKTQQQALMTTFFYFQPMVLLSGFMFPIENMPEPVQWLTFLDPLRYFLIIIRGIFLKGVGPEILWPQMAALLVMGLIIFRLAVRRFQKSAD
ncbi:MAG: ABC transporter permease [Nitrospinaceae bacterium]|nr:ABC transporter permease [Nitrospinaceae bacterium]NIR56506.1 ABC transporter permease [Nitrospinaceae bacterium]NIS86964.1 ABC transporter permease [Nitrospinaceae bacterium]NIT83808.1 ABC transporter permease [Nitrospinaceae bacterium]NIU46014.1 ABC transporter permease [Nitrospinaceae bacterium]